MKLRRIVKLIESEYKMQHRPADKSDGAPLNDLTENGIYPDDVYSSNAIRYYGTGDSEDSFVFRLIQAYKDTPNKKVWIYRAVPPDVNEINPNDWVTISMKYANNHRKGEKGWKTIKKQVSASEIFTDGNSWMEWGYDPS